MDGLGDCVFYFFKMNGCLRVIEKPVKILARLRFVFLRSRLNSQIRRFCRRQCCLGLMVLSAKYQQNYRYVLKTSSSIHKFVPLALIKEYQSRMCSSDIYTAFQSQMCVQASQRFQTMIQALFYSLFCRGRCCLWQFFTLVSQFFTHEK